MHEVGFNEIIGFKTEQASSDTINVNDALYPINRDHPLL